jgi:hypothetical protein
MLTATRSDVDCIAQNIRRYFVEGKTQQYGKPYRPQAKFNQPERWHAAAEICIDLKADPYSFVRSAFLYNTVPGGPFYTQLCGNAIRKWFAAYKQLNSVKEGEDVYAKEIEELIRACGVTAIQMAHLHNKPREQIFVEDLLMPEHQMPAWVRCVLYPTPKVLSTWGNAAYTEILGNSRLYSVLHEKEYNLNFLNRINARRSGCNG